MNRGSNKGHDLIIANFVDAIQNGSELIAPAVEGINSLMLSNAIILSAHRKEAVELPIDPDVYAALLQQYIEQPPV